MDSQNETFGPQEVAALRIEAAMTPRINLAFHQNAVPVLRELTLFNDGENALEAVELTLTSEPAFLAAKSWRIDAVPAGQRYHIPRLDVALDGALLGRLTEAESATVAICATAGGAELATATLPIELLPRNQWGGLGHIPEMVAAFVQPNDPAVERLLKSTAENLRFHGKSGALNGYDGGAKRVWELASALWGAVAGLGLDYALPPPSFEHAGQKVRGPSQIGESGLATCLDTTLLFCAALEHCGLNPVVVFTHGHAFAGVWLVNEEFATPVVDDPSALRKRVMLKELALFETTFVAQRPCPVFSRAVEQGARQIAETAADAFKLAVDIRRARLQRIRPLAGPETPAAAGPAPVAAEALQPVFEEAPADLPDLDQAPVPAVTETAALTPKDRLERWQRKLLDLSLRNSLLNFKGGKRAIMLDAPDPGLLEDILAEGRALRLRPRPQLMEGGDPRSQAIHEERTQEDLRREHALDALKRYEVLAGLTAEELDVRLTELYRAARAALQEGGANTLFLALGFLSWTKETRDSKDAKRYRAPLILVPVTLHRKSVRSGFSLELHDDEPRFNPTLLQMLRQDFRLTIPAVEDELPRDDSGLDLAGIWKVVGHAVKDVPGWEVAGDVTLASFSFAKHLMWKDLVDRTDQLKKNLVVRHLIDTPRDPFPGGAAFPDPRRLDAEHGPEQTFCPLPADSSQLAAVMAGARGKNFVLVGPPGTGKSQTIANLIAQCLAERKTVLFVSEKIAALEVVYRRLRDVGLGEFCLELHSSKARKLDVLDQLRRSWEAKGDADPAEWGKEATRLRSLRAHLNDFVERMHRRRRNGLSAYVAIGRVVAGRDLPALGLSWPSSDVHDEAALDDLLELTDRLDLNAGLVADVSHSALTLVSHGEWSPGWQRGLMEATHRLIAAAESADDAAENFRRTLSLPVRELDRRARAGLAGLARALPQAAGRDWRFVTRPDARTITNRLRVGLELLARRNACKADIAPPLPDAVLQALRRGLELLAKRRLLSSELASPLSEMTKQNLRYGLELLAKRQVLIAEIKPPLPDATLQGLRHGLELLSQREEIIATLSIPYSDAATGLDIERLRAEWIKAESSIWFLRGKRTKAVAAALMAAGIGDREPDVAADLDRLALLRDIVRQINTLKPTLALAGPAWAGLATDRDAIGALLMFQATLPIALSAAPWREDGLELVAGGRCGGAFAADLHRLLEIRDIEREINSLKPAMAQAEVVWKGLATDEKAVRGLLVYQDVLPVALSAAHWCEDGMEPVADGKCGAAFAADYRQLTALREIMRELDTLKPMSEQASPAWAGLTTDEDAVRALLAYQAALPAALSATPWREDGLGPVADGRCGEVCAADYRRLLELRAMERDLEMLDDLTTITGGLWAGLRTNPDAVEAALTFHGDLAAAVTHLAQTPDDLAAVKPPLERLIGDGNSLLEDGGPVVRDGAAAIAAFDAFDQALEEFARHAGSTVADIERQTGTPPAVIAAVCRGLPALERKLHAWCAWRKTRDEAMLKGLAPLVAALENDGAAPGSLRRLFEADYARWWLDAMVDGDAVLRSFVSAEHEKRIADFRALDDRFTDLTRAAIRAGLCAGLPDQDAVGKSSEWGLLRREMQKKRAHLPLRKLVENLPTALVKLAPCLLMSPLSIAQFLPADTALFDLVVFDEASQIPVWDAVGAIARGQQVVMVGDPKQLPPTAFFDRAESDGDEDDVAVEGDLESILDECMGANLPTRCLNWHYRSRHESLIAFSNHRYYEGGLVTFPSPVTDDRAVSFHHVGEGVYEKGGGRVNKPEAGALVADLVARLQDPAFRAARLTVGVVTFNSEQQRLIEDLLDDARRKAPDIEPFFAEDALEPVFVKNLESVQGDERDVMYFSITYGPDLTGAVSMNLGPMNRDGGERRLNVAVTRARHALRVFSSLRPEQFDLSRTAALGVRDLKHFLEFAERGARALAEATPGSIGGFESPFEQAVARALTAKGWRVQPQIGVSAFRIDLGVVDPDAPGRYLAGVECDGAAYHRSATARDRDKLREQVLRGLGWEILRIWSTDWWHDADGALEKVDARLTALLAASRARREVEVRRLAEVAQAAAEAAEATAALCAATPEEEEVLPEPVVDELRPAIYARNAAAQSPETAHLPTFTEADPAAAVDAVAPDAFFDLSYDEKLWAMIDHVVAVEGPVRDDVLARRIARAHGWSRTGGRIARRIADLTDGRFPTSEEDGCVFLWPPGADVAAFPAFRRSSGDAARPVDEIALPELIALARAALATGAVGDDAVTVMARLAGLGRLRAVTRNRLAAAQGKAPQLYE